MSEWQTKTIADLGKVVTGSTPPSRNPGWFGDSTAFVTPSDMAADDRRPRPGRWLSGEGRSGLRTRIVPPDSVAFVCIGATIGKACLLPSESVTNQQINTVIPGDEADARFLYYLLRHIAPTIAQAASGAATPIINKSAFSAVQVEVPDFESQTRIGAVLGSLDDLIENNRRRVEVLEQMARTIYREWFVKFRYPGHQDVPLVDSAFGPIPEGWTVKTCAELSSVVVRGISPKYAEAGEWIVLNQKCIRDGRVLFGPSRRQERAVADTKRVRPGDVLINSTGVGTLGRVAMYRGASQGVTVDSHITIARAAEESINPWYAMSMLAKQAEIEQLGTGATGQTELRKSDVEALELVQPVASVAEAFADVVSLLLQEVDALLADSAVLSNLRDLLLPKLVTGQINLSSLDLAALVSTGSITGLEVA